MKEGRTPPPSAPSYWFGPFRLEPGERRLLRDGEAVALTPKAFDLLHILVESPGRLLRKEDLLERLWPGVFVEEVNLAQNVSQIRRVLGGADKGTYAQTVSGVGYRFVAEVRRTEESNPAGGPDTSIAPASRLIVLPFRMLKADADVDFLAFSLPDALASSLSHLNSMIVRSSLMAGRFSGDAADLGRIAAEADVNLVLTGTLLRAGDKIRVTAQLADAVAGTLMWSYTADAALGDLFRLQDSLVDRIVDSLQLRLTPREHRLLKHDVPASAKAYECFLRANQISQGARWWTDIGTWTSARDLYVRCLDEDPRFAPAWAALGRVHRVMATYVPQGSRENFSQAESACRKALELNPDLPSAQHLYAQIEMDLGRAGDAMVRLLGLARSRSNDATLFAALCQVCRYCGLLEPSLAAHERASRLDPASLTSVAHTHYLLGHYATVVDIAERSWGGYGSIGLIALAAVGRQADAVVAAVRMEATAPPLMRALIVAARCLIEGKREESLAALEQALPGFTDPEPLFYCARQFARLGEHRRALDALRLVRDRGYNCYPALERDSWFDPLRGNADFQQIVGELHVRHQSLAAAFVEAGGPAVLEGTRIPDSAVPQPVPPAAQRLDHRGVVR